MEDRPFGSHLDVVPLLQQPAACDLRTAGGPHADAKLPPRAAIQALDDRRPVAANSQTQTPLRERIPRIRLGAPLAGSETIREHGHRHSPEDAGRLTPSRRSGGPPPPAPPPRRRPPPGPYRARPAAARRVDPPGPNGRRLVTLADPGVTAGQLRCGVRRW